MKKILILGLLLLPSLTYGQRLKGNYNRGVDGFWAEFFSFSWNGKFIYHLSDTWGRYGKGKYKIDDKTLTLYFDKPCEIKSKRCKSDSITILIEVTQGTDNRPSFSTVTIGNKETIRITDKEGIISWKIPKSNDSLKMKITSPVYQEVMVDLEGNKHHQIKINYPNNGDFRMGTIQYEIVRRSRKTLVLKEIGENKPLMIFRKR